MNAAELIKYPVFKSGLHRAWLDSKPGLPTCREEGGFVCLTASGSIEVARWPHGSKNEILLPHHTECFFVGRPIVASFHTHPNLRTDFEQGPSITDIRAVRDDPNLKSEIYLGEFVISCENIYLIRPDGDVEIISSFEDFFEGYQT